MEDKIYAFVNFNGPQMLFNLTRGASIDEAYKSNKAKFEHIPGLWKTELIATLSVEEFLKSLNIKTMTVVESKEEPKPTLENLASLLRDNGYIVIKWADATPELSNSFRNEAQEAQKEPKIQFYI